MTVHQNHGVHRFALLVSGATFFLVIAGASVTSTGSGLAVPDWPLSFGTLFPPMEGGVLYEHSHRMIAGAVLVLTIILNVWLFRREERPWVRNMGLVTLVLLVVQALLGGLTVLNRLPPAISVSHAGLAVAVFGLTVSLALVTSPGWREFSSRSETAGLAFPRGLALVTACAIYLQIVLGAIVRHVGAGLAIPDFPLSFGRLFPPDLSAPIVLHYAHRVGAFVVSVCACLLIVRIVRNHRDEAMLRRLAVFLAGVLALQLMLGALTIWTRRAVVPTTAHVAFGAVTLALCLMLTLWLYRLQPLRAARPVRLVNLAELTLNRTHKP